MKSHSTVLALAVFLLASALPAVGAPAVCTNSALTPWPVSSGGNGNSYQVICATTPTDPSGLTGGIDWASANTAANTAGGHLATLTSAAENTFVATLVNDPLYWYASPNGLGLGPWIGLSRPLPCGSGLTGFVWVTGEPFSFSNFAAGEPSCGSGVEHVVEFFNGNSTPPGATWNDLNSSYHTNAYVIEFENVIPVLTPTSVPTLSWGGQIALIALLASIGVGFLVRRIAG